MSSFHECVAGSPVHQAITAAVQNFLAECQALRKSTFPGRHSRRPEVRRGAPCRGSVCERRQPRSNRCARWEAGGSLSAGFRCGLAGGAVAGRVQPVCQDRGTSTDSEGVPHCTTERACLVEACLVCSCCVELELATYLQQGKASHSPATGQESEGSPSLSASRNAASMPLLCRRRHQRRRARAASTSRRGFTVGRRICSRR